MEEAHRRSIFYMAPAVLSKVFLLSEMAGGHDEVGDPFGGTMEAYGRTADELAGLIDKGLPKILKQIGILNKKPGFCQKPGFSVSLLAGDEGMGGSG